MVDNEGYVALHTNRYSVPADFIGRRVDVRELRERIEIELDARRIVTHSRLLTTDQRVTLREHRPPRGKGPKRSDPHPDEQAILHPPGPDSAISAPSEVSWRAAAPRG